MATLTVSKHTTVPATPSAGHSRLYCDSNGAFKSVDETGEVYSLITTNTEVSATTQTTASGTGYAQINSMTVTVGVGTYLVIFTGHIMMNNASSYAYFALHKDGAIVQHSERIVHYMSSHNHQVWYSVVTCAKITVSSGTSTITAQWKSPQSVTMTMDGRSLQVLNL